MRRADRAWIGAIAVALATGAVAQEPKKAETPSKPGPVERVAQTPLRDLNIVRDEVPPLLEEVVKNPYARAGAANCTQIAASVRDLDAVLGEDIDSGNPAPKGSAVEAVGKAAAGSIIPAGGIVRLISGAAANARAYSAAIVAGSVRRGFLKGIGAGKGCKFPAAPR